jgi:hypothetical protein
MAPQVQDVAGLEDDRRAAGVGDAIPQLAVGVPERADLIRLQRPERHGSTGGVAFNFGVRVPRHQRLQDERFTELCRVHVGVRAFVNQLMHRVGFEPGFTAVLVTPEQHERQTGNVARDGGHGGLKGRCSKRRLFVDEDAGRHRSTAEVPRDGPIVWIRGAERDRPHRFPRLSPP